MDWRYNKDTCPMCRSEQEEVKLRERIEIIHGSNSPQRQREAVLDARRICAFTISAVVVMLLGATFVTIQACTC